MPLKKSAGNMYPWVDAQHSHLGGECCHHCSYCYVDNPRSGRPERYTGPIHLIEEEFGVRYDEKTLTSKHIRYPATIFIEHMNDLFARDVTDDMIRRVIAHCLMFPENTYVLQTKNPQRYGDWRMFLPKNVILGTTIESNRFIPEIMKDAPMPCNRYIGMLELATDVRKFITIEPVLDFDIDELAGWIANIKPEFLNLGADSKGRGLPEPTVEKVMALVAKLHGLGVELREKHNLERLKAK